MTARVALTALVFLVAGPLAALEKLPAREARERPTAGLDQVTVKPLVLVNLRGRQDPFMAYALVTTTASTEHLSIANLSFTGLIQVQGALVALFKDNQGQTYTLKGGRLHGLDNQPLPGVRGRVGDGREVWLEQGSRRIQYSNHSSSKRLESGRSR